MIWITSRIERGVFLFLHAVISCGTDPALSGVTITPGVITMKNSTRKKLFSFSKNNRNSMTGNVCNSTSSTGIETGSRGFREMIRAEMRAICSHAKLDY